MALCLTVSLFAGTLLSANPALWKPKPTLCKMHSSYETAPSSDFETGKFEGRVLHVDSGKELEFRSVKELVMFVSKMHGAQPRKGCRVLRTRKVQKQPPTHIQLKDR